MNIMINMQQQQQQQQQQQNNQLQQQTSNSSDEFRIKTTFYQAAKTSIKLISLKIKITFFLIIKFTINYTQFISN